MDRINAQPLAFASTAESRKDLVCATSRLPFKTSDGTATLNVEYFCFDNNTDKDSVLLLFVHGICESAETSSVQFIVSEAKSLRWCDVAVLELEGHGLSSGQTCVCGDFDRLVKHVVEFVRCVLRSLSSVSSYALCGTSLGGVLAAYASDILSRQQNDNDLLPHTFLGAALIAPAVGIDPTALPPSPLVGALRLMSAILPSLTLPLTPLEDPTHYNCPKDTTRNYAGYWPLATSRMLLDVTSTRVKHDIVRDGKVTLEHVPSLLVLAGEQDNVVPLESIKKVYDKSKTIQKKLVTVPNSGHDMMFHESSARVVLDELFCYLADSCQTQQKEKSNL